MDTSTPLFFDPEGSSVVSTTVLDDAYELVVDEGDLFVSTSEPDSDSGTMVWFDTDVTDDNV